MKIEKTAPKGAATQMPIGILVQQILFTVRSAAESGFGHLTDDSHLKLSPLESRMILELGAGEQLTMTALVRLVGHHKSQVSRSLKRLLELDLVHRSTLRSPLQLSSVGKSLFAKAKAGAYLTNKQLFKGLSRSEQGLLMASIARLTQTAVHLLTEELEIEASSQSAAKSNAENTAMVDGPIAGTSLLPTMIVPRLVTFMTLLHRSSFLAFKRLTNLSNFESIILTHIWERAPLTSKELSTLTGRNKSQVDRAVAFLIGVNLVERHRSNATHDWILDRNKHASNIYRRLVEETQRREAVLQQSLGANDLSRIRLLLERIANNAVLVASE